MRLYIYIYVYSCPGRTCGGGPAPAPGSRSARCLLIVHYSGGRLCTLIGFNI